MIERRDGVLLTVVDQSIQGYSTPYDNGELTMHIADVGTASDELLQRVNSELQMTLQPNDVGAFPGFPQRDFVGNQVEPMSTDQSTIALAKLVGKPGEFLLVTGAAKHFLLLEPTVNPCPCHDWTFCQEHGVEQGASPILSRSVDPPAFFMSREVHHCANRIVHDRRNPRCQIDAFEEFLCCRACALQNFCWQSQELSSLPCGKSVAGT